MKLSFSKKNSLFKNTFQLRKRHGKNFIGFKLCGSGNKVVSVRNNHTEVSEATDFEIGKACLLASIASQGLRKRSNATILRFLSTVAEEIKKIEKTVIPVTMRETGFHESRVQYEFNRTLTQISCFSNMLKDGSFVDARLFTQQTPPKPDLRRMLIPLGPIAVFGASNFPYAYSVPGGDTISAFATKNPVIFKAHPAHAETCELMAEAIQSAVEKSQLPEGTFSMVHGEEKVGATLVSNPFVKGVGFTGSIAGGRALFDLVNKRPQPIPVYAEMGSVNPIVVFPNVINNDKLVEKFVENYTNSFTSSCGQMCTKPGLVFLINGDVDVVNKLLVAIQKKVSQVPAQRMLTNGIQDSYLKGVDRFLSIKGLTSIERNPDKLGENGELKEVGACSLFVKAPTFIKNFQMLTQEIFGPVSLLVHFNSMDEIKEVYSMIDGQLSSSIHATEKDIQEYDIQGLIEAMTPKIGRLIFNGFPTGLEVTNAIHHGGPFPACSDIRTGAVGGTAMMRWVRPLCFQGFVGSAENLLPDQLKDKPLEPIKLREINNEWEHM